MAMTDVQGGAQRKQQEQGDRWYEEDEFGAPRRATPQSQKSRGGQRDGDQRRERRLEQERPEEIVRKAAKPKLASRRAYGVSARCIAR